MSTTHWPIDTFARMGARVADWVTLSSLAEGGVLRGSILNLSFALADFRLRLAFDTNSAWCYKLNHWPHTSLLGSYWID